MSYIVVYLVVLNGSYIWDLFKLQKKEGNVKIYYVNCWNIDAKRQNIDAKKL